MGFRVSGVELRVQGLEFIVSSFKGSGPRILKIKVEGFYKTQG